ncbi:MAG TPA: hypothetical protein VGV35_20495, partial [Bryobacteraceae bacterium]|nr:hypothetical protein [Bryobacteraceae bacterium]
LYSSSSLRWLEKIQQTQVLLGEIRDWRAVEELISPYKGGDALAGWLKKRQRKQREEFRQYWRQHFGDPENVRMRIDSLSCAGARVRILKKPAGRSVTYSSRSATA